MELMWLEITWYYDYVSRLGIVVTCKSEKDTTQRYPLLVEAGAAKNQS